jgi:hypothetical protein
MCGTLGTSGHVTAKSSISEWGVRYTSGVDAWNALYLTPGGLQRVPQGLRGSRGFLTAWQKSAEGIGGGGNEPGPVVRRTHPTEGPNGSPRGD